MKLVVGLGNPGPQYETTRHNVGFMAVDFLGDSLGAGADQKLGKSLLAKARYKGEDIILVKPQDYMNRSGIAVAELVSYFDLTPDDLIVIHDDMDLDLGRLRIRVRGGHGGHRGIASIMKEIGTQKFCRIKIGIGRPPEDVDPSDYVLSSFSKTELKIVKDTLLTMGFAVRTIVAEGIDAAMNDFNTYGKHYMA